MNKKRMHIIAVAILAMIAQGITSTPPESEKADSIRYHLDSMVVIGTKIPGPQSELAASVSIVRQDLLQLGSPYSVLETVSDMVPGLNLSERAVMGYGVSSGAAGGISIRGVGGSPVTGVLVLRDGRPDIMGLMGHPLPDAYSSEGVERVEVIRGPASFLYGTNAMGGVINMISKRVHDDGFQTQVSAGAGSFASQVATVAHGGKRGPFDYYLTAMTRKTDGHRPESDYDGKHYTGHMGYQLAEKTAVELNLNLSDFNLMDPGPSASPVRDHWYDIRRSGADLGLNHTGSFGESSLKLHGNFGTHKIYDGFRSSDRTSGVMLVHHVQPWQGQKLTVGLDWKQYGGSAKNVLSALDYGSHFITEWAPYVHSQQWLGKAFLVSAGLRVEHHPLYGYTPMPKAGVVYTIRHNTYLRVSAAKGFRSPSIRELYLFPAPTLDLKPERMWNYEVGLNQQILNHFKWEAVLFKAEGEDLIRLSGRWPNFKLANSGTFTHTGYELVLEWLANERWQVGATWSKLDLQDQTLNAPAKKLTAYSNLALGIFSLQTNLVYVQDQYGADQRSLAMGDYTVVNGQISVRLLKPLTLSVAVKNLLDADYQTLYGYPMPGRYMLGNLTVSL
jgi:outer membrane cobalamin receptor